MEGPHGGDIPPAAGGDPGQLQGHLHRLGAAVGEEAVLQLPGGDVRHGLGQVAPQGVQQLLGVEGLMVQLGFHHVQNLRVSVAAGVDAEAAQAVNKLFPIEAIAVGAFVLPLQHGPRLRVRRDRLAVGQPAGAHIVVEMLHGLLYHLFLLRGRNRLNIRMDQRNHPVQLLNHLFLF